LIVPNIGPLELIIVLIVVLLVVGPKRLPGLGRQLGTGMREFKESISGKGSDDAGERDDRRRADAALGRPEGEGSRVEPVDGDVVSERTRR
jgi:sec-independent protein translocase protein TatA